LQGGYVVRIGDGRGTDATPEVPEFKGGTLEAGVKPTPGRLSWEQAHRLELTLRARASRFSGGSGNVCPGCGRMVSPAEEQLRLAGHLVHPECLPTDGRV
jgi:hypothetical protein